MALPPGMIAPVMDLEQSQFESDQSHKLKPTAMKIEAKVTHRPNGYGFGHDWTLVITKEGEFPKSFMLGQDAKVCSRCLGASPADVIKYIGGNDIDVPEVNKNLTNLILQEYAQHDDEDPEVTAEAIYDSAEPWHLAVE